MRICFTLLLLALSLPAQAKEGLSESYDSWLKLRDPNALTINFSDGAAFLAKHPGWPDEKTIRLRTETAAMQEKPSRAVMEKFCTNFPPISGRGMIACAATEAGTAAQQKTWVKQGWLQGDFNEDEETRIVRSYADLFTAADYTARTERLLYEGKTLAAKRMLSLVPADRRERYKVRIALINNESKAAKMLADLPATQQRETGVLFDRARWHMKRDESPKLATILMIAPAEVPYADLWWPMRAYAARDAIRKNNYTNALKILAHPGDIKSESLADALWLKGWIHLRHKSDAASAYKEFFKLYNSVYTPVSKARAAYWAGRAAEQNENKAIAAEWMEKAARHPTVFYGQLAQHWLGKDRPLALPAMPTPTEEERKQFGNDDLVLVTRALGSTGDDKMRDLFLVALSSRATTPGQFALIADLAAKTGGPGPGVDVAKLALRNGVVLIDQGWPRIDIPDGLRIEPALTLAITRQESEFDPLARSSANARGLMQLLPSTAKQTAKKIGMDYSDRILDNPADNMTLGSSYLGQIIDGFDGSYILGIASYNAGPGSVRKWIAATGTPPKNLNEAIDWIEAIPFGETRNYVMRALENVNVYRTLAEPLTPLGIAKDLTR